MKITCISIESEVGFLLYWPSFKLRIFMQSKNLSKFLTNFSVSRRDSLPSNDKASATDLIYMYAWTMYMSFDIELLGIAVALIYQCRQIHSHLAIGCQIYVFVLDLRENGEG